MDNSDIRRIAAPDLADEAISLLEAYRDSDDAVFFLARFAWLARVEGCLPILLEIARDHARGRYARIASVRAVMTMGSAQDIALLFGAIASETNLDRKLLAELIEDADPDEQTIVFIGASIGNLEPFERFHVTGLEQALHGLVERLPIVRGGGGPQLLFRLVEILTPFLEREPYVERGECHISKDFAWLMPIALHAVDRLVSNRAVEALETQCLAVMRNMPALRYWSQGDVNEYREQLHANVPRWTLLNDALYWSSVAERRAFVERKDGSRLTEDWRISFLRPFWNFGRNDFDRCVEWVRARENPDDRLVALSRAFTLYREHDRPPAWLIKLQEACKGQEEATAKLAEMLAPKPSAEVEKMEEEHREYKRKREAEEADQARIRGEWIETLRANPSRVTDPAGLSPGEFSADQYHLMMSASDENSAWSRGYSTNWRSLEPEFGEEVALAYRKAAMAHWRQYDPQLPSEGAEIGSTPYSLVFAMAGLAIEAAEEQTFPSALSRAEVERAFRYVTWELNGFPDWFETLFNAYPTEGLEAIRKELAWELKQRSEGSTPHHVLHDIMYYSPWLHEHVARPVHDWLTAGSPIDPDGLRYAIAIMKSGSIPFEELATLAKTRAAAEVNAGQRSRWFALWVETDPAPAIEALEGTLVSLPDPDASQFAQSFIVDLVGGRHGAGPRLDGFREAAHLKALYVLMHRYIVAEHDIQRANTGVYSPVLRDDAQEARNRLFNMLAEIPGQESYEAIAALANEHPSPTYRSWMSVRARERAIADADEPAWPDAKIWEVSNRQLA